MTLTTDSQNVILRPLHFSDNEKMAGFANNRNIWNNLKDYIPLPFSISDADYLIALKMKESPQLTFGIEYKQEFVGVIGLVPLKDIYRRSAEIGYWIGEPFWNKNIGRTAVAAVTSYGLIDMDFIRIQAGVFEYNIPSMRVLEKCNYRKEGIFVKSVWKNDQFWNEHKYAIVKENSTNHDK